MSSQMTDLSNFAGIKVLVTGGSGFIGSMLCEQLRFLGADTHAISRRQQSSDGSAIKWWRGNLADESVVQDLFNSIRPEIVYHLASEVKGGRELDLVVPTLKANLVSTVNVLVAATEVKSSRIVLAGSLEEPDAGEISAVPASPYAAAKFAGGAYARMFHALYHTPVVLARLFMVYGPGQKDLKKLIPYVTLSLLRNEIPSLASGSRLVDWIYINDVVQGLLKMGFAPGIEGATIELGTGDMATTREVAESLRNIIDPDARLEFGALSDRPMEQIRRADVQKSFEQMGWRPEVPLKQGLQATVDWYKRQLDRGDI